MLRQNTSAYSDDQTACTIIDCAHQRARNLSILGSKNVLELCVGPSLKTLESCYQTFNIKVTGNDIDARWHKYYPSGNWIIGDALKIDYSEFNTVVFAPPLSLQCSGRREDSLMINDVNPKYTDFIKRIMSMSKTFVLVCPGRSTRTKADRNQLYGLLNNVSSHGFRHEIDLLKTSKRNIIKYTDIYICKDN